jgi:hypothetical protein
MSADPDVSVMVPQRVSTVVLTGAGFSVAAGLPLTKELVPRGRTLLKGRLGIEFVNALDELALQVLEELVGEDIEALLARLKVLEFYSEKYSTKVPGSTEEHNYITIAVGMPVTGHPPHRSVRAALPHTALTLDAWRQSAHSEMDAGCAGWESSVGSRV